MGVCLFALFISMSFFHQCLSSNLLRIEPEQLDPVLEGQTVTLMCYGDPNHCNLEEITWWIESGGVLADDPNIIKTLNSELNAVNLTFISADVHIENKYYCRCKLPMSNTVQLRVLVPPKLIFRDLPANNGPIIASVQNTLTLTCQAENAKPRIQTIFWAKHNIAISDQRVSTSYSSPGEKQKLHTTTSQLKLDLTSADNGAEITCWIMKAPNVPQQMGIKALLNVTYGPKFLRVSASNNGQPVSVGTIVEFTCSTTSGNPIPPLTWMIADNAPSEIIETTLSKEKSTALFRHKMERNDINKQFDCVTNGIEKVVKQSIHVDVYFPPEDLKITGTEHEISVGDTVVISCTSGVSNPAAKIRYKVDGIEIVSSNPTSTYVPESGGYTSSAHITVHIKNSFTPILVECKARNAEIDAEVSKSITVQVQVLPEPPVITLHSDKNHIFADDSVEIQCQTNTGIPVPDLKLLFAGKDTSNLSTFKNDSTSILTYSFQAQSTDNKKRITCIATNLPELHSVNSSIDLLVYYAPSGISMNLSPSNTLEVGNDLTITCTTDVSFPNIDIEWSKDGAPLSDELFHTNTVETDDGFTTNSIVILKNVTANLDGAEYQCSATKFYSPSFKPLVDSRKLNVRYQPIFDNSKILSQTWYNKTEGHSLELSCDAHANPSKIFYEWTFNSETLPSDFQAMGPKITVDRLKIEYTGRYECKASNEIGRTTAVFNLNVYYSPRVSAVQSVVYADEGTTARLACKTQANPFNSDIFSWYYNDQLLTSLQAIMHAEESILSIQGVRRKEAGRYTCVANNGVPPTASAVVTLIIKYPPVMDLSAMSSKLAVDPGQEASLICIAKGAPEVTFAWLHEDGNPIANSIPQNRMRIRFSRLSDERFQSELTIYSVMLPADYHGYSCRADNEKYPPATYKIWLVSKGKPETPLNLRVLNVTQSAIFVSWTPGFDGGYLQKFNVRYHIEGDNVEHDKYVSTSSFLIKNLKHSSRYVVMVRASNQAGYSEFCLSVTADTQVGSAAVKATIDFSDIPLWLLLILFALTVLFFLTNIIFICVFITKRLSKSSNMSDSQVRFQSNIKMTGRANDRFLPSDRFYSSSRASESSFDKHSVSLYHNELANEYIEQQRAQNLSQPPAHMLTSEVNPTDRVPTNPNLYYRQGWDTLGRLRHTDPTAAANRRPVSYACSSPSVQSSLFYQPQARQKSNNGHVVSPTREAYLSQKEDEGEIRTEPRTVPSDSGNGSLQRFDVDSNFSQRSSSHPSSSLESIDMNSKVYLL